MFCLFIYNSNTWVVVAHFFFNSEGIRNIKDEYFVFCVFFLFIFSLWVYCVYTMKWRLPIACVFVYHVKNEEQKAWVRSVYTHNNTNPSLTIGNYLFSLILHPIEGDDDDCRLCVLNHCRDLLNYDRYASNRTQIWYGAQEHKRAIPSNPNPKVQGANMRRKFASEFHLNVTLRFMGYTYLLIVTGDFTPW